MLGANCPRRQHERAPVQPRLGEFLKESPGDGKRLGAFADGHGVNAGVPAGRVERITSGGGEERRDGSVGEDGATAAQLERLE